MDDPAMADAAGIYQQLLHKRERSLSRSLENLDSPELRGRDPQVKPLQEMDANQLRLSREDLDGVHDPNEGGGGSKLKAARDQMKSNKWLQSVDEVENRAPEKSSTPPAAKANNRATAVATNNAEIQILEEECGELREMIEKLNKENGELQAENTGLKTEVTLAKATTEGLRSDRKELREELDEKSQKWGEERRELKTANEQLTEAKAKQEEFVTTLQEAEDYSSQRIEELEKENDELRETAQTINTLLLDVQAQRDVAFTERDGALEKHMLADEALQVKLKQITEIERALASRVKQFAELEEEQADLAEKLNEKDEELRRKDEQMERFQKFVTRGGSCNLDNMGIPRSRRRRRNSGFCSPDDPVPPPDALMRDSIAQIDEEDGSIFSRNASAN